MASIPAIRDGLKTRLATISGLRAHDTAPGEITPPAAIVVPGVPGGDDPAIRFDSTFARGSDDFVFTVTLLVSKAHDRASQDALDGYLATDGATSIKAAIEADETLGGTVDFARVASVHNYGAMRYGAIDYLGADFRIEVTA